MSVAVQQIHMIIHQDVPQAGIGCKTVGVIKKLIQVAPVMIILALHSLCLTSMALIGMTVMALPIAEAGRYVSSVPAF